jgi:hypothetical protein
MACFPLDSTNFRMKLVFVQLLFLLSLNVLGQNSRSVAKTVSDNGKTLKLKYEVIGSGKEINYINEFDITGWSKQQKEILVSRIIDSLENYSNTENDYLHKWIDDNGGTLTIAITARKKGTTTNYNKSFNVKGMNQSQKNALIDSTLQSLGLNKNQN